MRRRVRDKCATLHVVVKCESFTGRYNNHSSGDAYMWQLCPAERQVTISIQNFQVLRRAIEVELVNDWTSRRSLETRSIRWQEAVVGRPRAS
jgi:hypothetical protein